MKRYLIVFFVLVLAAVANAQEHLTFKGVPLGGDISIFVSKLELKGYYVEEKSYDEILMIGDFAGVDTCEVYLSPTPKSRLVWNVTVKFPQKASWQALKGEYLSLKEAYTQKYGEPESYEFFMSPYEEGDGNEMDAVCKGKCGYASFYTLDKGNVVLGIYNDGCVFVVYEDAITYKVCRDEVEANMMNDI